MKVEEERTVETTTIIETEKRLVVLRGQTYSGNIRGPLMRELKTYFKSNRDRLQ